MSNSIDIRDTSEEKITQIRFSSEDGVAIKLRLSIGGEVLLVDNIGDGNHSFDLQDIDNLIKALEKAKELWG